MAVRIETMAEPLPGYRLIERLGGGGFGEVWKAEAPGGIFKAIKFVYGDLDASGEEGARAGQEFKALQRVITVRHPFILSLERFDIIDGQLMIVTELADRTLWDRFRECRTQGLIGIPREELLSYLDDTAEALDLMHTQHQLQHLDIKPQNLFLVGNHVKVADFGLVKDLEGMLASVTGGVTPVYAAPETFEGKVSRFSDQYSLAIVYQELLTGQRPYSGQTLRQLVLQHCQGTPDLKPLPEHDRPIVLHALAKKHEERFPSCTEFVNHLRRASLQLPGPSADSTKLTPEDKPPTETDADGSKTEGRPERTPPRPPVPDEPWPEPVARRDSAIVEPYARPSGSGSISVETPTHGLNISTPASSRPPVVHQTDGVLVPALVIGLGQFGLGTLRRLRQEICDNFGAANVLPAIRFLYIDADPETGQRATRGIDQAALRPSEVLLTRLRRPSNYIKPREGTTGLETWLNPKMLYRMPRQQTAAGIRALGRLAFVDNLKIISRRLQRDLEDCCSQDALERTSAETGLSLRTAVPRVYLVANLGGGTGSGMLIDMAYLARQELRQLGYDNAEVNGICYLPPADNDPRRLGALANSFAALTELNHFGQPQRTFTARYELGEVRSGSPVFSWKGPPFTRCQFFALPDAQTAIAEDASGGPAFPPVLAQTFALAARCLFTELMTPLGRAADDFRQRAEQPTAPTAQGPGNQRLGSQGPRYDLVGLDRCVWPRRQVLDQTASRLCRRIVQRWMSKDAKPIKEAVQQWVRQQWEEHGLSAEQIITRYQQAGEKALGTSPETAFQNIHVGVVKGLQTQPGKPGDGALNLAVVMDAMEQYEHMVGIPEEFQPVPPRGEPSSYQPGTLEISLQELGAAVVDQYEQKMNVLAVRLIEDPSYRLAGAEEALRQLHAQVEQALTAQEHLAQELLKRSAMVYKRIQQLTSTSGSVMQSSTLMWKAPFSRRTGLSPQAQVAELQELLRTYPKVRLQALIMHRVTVLYVSLRGQLSDQLREVDFCRARLSELQNLFGGPTTHGEPELPAAGRFLFARGSHSLEEAVQKLDSSVSTFDLLELDTRLQTLIRKQFKALVHVCMSTSNMLRALAPALQKETRAYLRGRMGEINVGEIFLQQFADQNDASERLEDQLLEAFERAAPEVVASSPARELNLFAVPVGHAEEELRKLARNAVDNQTLEAVASQDEITFYREHTLGCLADLKQLGAAGQDAYHKMVARENFTPHSRADIVAWGTRAQ